MALHFLRSFVLPVVAFLTGTAAETQAQVQPSPTQTQSSRPNIVIIWGGRRHRADQRQRLFARPDGRFISARFVVARRAHFSGRVVYCEGRKTSTAAVLKGKQFSATATLGHEMLGIIKIAHSAG